MYENEFKFLQDHIDLVENNKFDELFKLIKYPVKRENIFKICYDPDVNIDPLAGLTTIPQAFFESVNLPELDLVVPSNITGMAPNSFFSTTFRSIKFENPDCKVILPGVTAETIIMPANSTLDDASGNNLSNVDAKVILSKNTNFIGRNAINGRSSGLILIWTSPDPVKMSVEYTPRNKNSNWWHVTKNNLHIRR